MAFKLQIKLTGQSQFTDFSNFVFAEPGASLATKTFALNSIQQLDFVLKEASGFVSPERGNEVWLDCATYSPSGELFTGFIAADPEKQLFALENDGNLRYKWRVTCQSEESMCNFTAPLYMSTLVPFQNKNVGQIVTYLLGLLAPGRFDTTGIQAGPIIPYYLPNAAANFTDIIKELVEGAGMKFWTRRKKAFLAYFDDVAVGVNAISTDPAFNPDDITITPYAQPIFNDVVGYGGEEPQVFVREYYSGDGLSMTFPLHLPAYGLTTTDLIIDDFNNSTLDLNKWVETDPTSAIAEGASLFIEGGAGLNLTKVAAVQGLELAGTLFFQHGAVRFNSASSGILGGLYSSPSAHTLANCLAGIKVLSWSAGAGTLMQPMVSGKPASPAENFDVAQNPLPTGTWLTPPSGFSLQASGGRVMSASTTGVSSWEQAYYVGPALSSYNDGYVQAKLIAVTGVNSGVAVLGRCATGSLTYYHADVLAPTGSSPGNVRIYARVAGNFNFVAQVTGVAYNPGDLLRLEIAGTQLTVKINGVPLLTAIDAQIPSGQAWGLSTSNASKISDAILDDWESGPLSYSNVATVPGQDYILQTQVQAPERVRRLRNFSSLQTPSGFGGVDVPANVFVSMRALAVSVADASLPPTASEMYNGTVSGAPTFVNYVPFNSDNLNIAVNFLEVSSPMDVLALHLPSGSSTFKTYTLGAQKEVDKDGSIVSQANQSTQNFQTLGSLGLFGLQAPSAGDVVEVRYRSAGQMVARVVEPSSLILEASRLGDNGERAGLLPQLNFAPRNQAELEFAIKSYIDDRDSPIFQGTYSFTTLRYTPPAEPIPGRFFTVNVSGTYPSFLAFANSIRTDITVESPSLPSGQAEIMSVDVTYGNLDKFQSLMTQLSLQDQGGQSNINIRGVTLPVSTDFALVGATTGPNLPDFRYAYSSPYGTNLLTNSQSFDNAAWVKSVLSPVSGDTVIAPDGTLSAESITASSSSTDSSLVQNVTLGSTAYTFSVWMKVPTTPISVDIGIRDSVGPATDFVKLCPLTTTWQKFSVTRPTTQPGGGLVFIGAYSTWVSGAVIHAWGAQMQPGSGTGPYLATLGASSNSMFHNVDFGQSPPTGAGGDLGHFEVRYSDANWGLPGTTNLISEVSGQQASLTRSSRSQQYFARGIVPVNLALHSGFEDGVNYLSASGANPPTGSYDSTRGGGDFGCVKVVFPAGSTACSGSFTNCAVSGIVGTTLAGRVKFMASRPLTGSEEIRFKWAGGFNPTAETALTSANIGSGTYSSFRDFVVGPTTAPTAAVAFSDPGSGANSSPIGGNWTTLAGTNALQRIGNVFEPTVSGSSIRGAAFYNPFTPPPNQYSEIVVGRADSANNIPGAGCRMSSAGGENGYYALVLGPLGASAQLFIQRSVTGTVTNIANGTFTVASGDAIRMECSGTALTLKQNGVTRLTIADSNLTSGNFGMFEYVNGTPITGTQISSWNGGTFGVGNDARLTVYVKSALTTPLTGWVDDVQVEKNPPAYAPSPYYRTTLLPKGYASRYASLVAINFPLLPIVVGAKVDYTNVNAPVITIDPAILLNPDLFGYTITDAAGNVLVTVTGGGLLASDLVFVDQKNRTANLNYFIKATNSLGESGPSFNLVATIPPLANDGLTADSSALNLVPNGDLSVATDPTGIRCVRASAIRVQDNPALGFPSPNGWTRSFESKANGEGAFYRNMNFAGASFAGSPFIGVAQDSGGGAGQNFAAVCDAFAVRATVNYRFSAAVWPNQGGTGLGGANTLPLHATWYFRVLWYVVGATDFSRFSPDLISLVDIVSNSTQNGPVYPFKIIQAPSNAGYCRIAFYHWDDNTSVATGWNMVFTSVRCTALLTAFDVTPINTSGTFTGASPLSQSGITSTILIAASTMQFADGTISFNSGSVNPGFGTWYIYADDPTYSGGAVTYVATSAPSTTYANNGRIYFGKITTNAGGGATGTGGGSGGGRTLL